jgi:hypothetical protein
MTSRTRAAKSGAAKSGDATSGDGPHNFKGLLDSLLTKTEGDKVTLGGLLDVVGRRSFGPVILLLGFIAISPLTIIPGASWLVAAITLLFAGQILIGRRAPWLPRKLLQTEFPREYLEKAVAAGQGAAHVADKLTKPRLTFLTEPPFVFVTALCCVAAALITFPLGLIPFGPVLPGLSIVLMGVGMTARDGVWLSLAMLSLGGAVLMLGRWLL